ncbi:phosphopantetheine-binding protein [Azospirillum sp.]|uniref:phosphopantetheine-binding protein n=1 Tax=Azospirillum sp. TaxID=34012 RepID=UPI002D48F3A7|nr:phosphopantetheine-binding protein [Azospirillum sp.]HYD70513.1 phosphopantetheine-binding protein [Azospirillum sp.]
MNRPEFLRALDELLELDPGTLKGDEVLEALESWDSLAVISFIALVDETFGTVVAGEKLAKAATIADLLELAGVAETA